MKAVFDTNILVDYLNGEERAREELARFDRPVISIINWIELMVGTTSQYEDLAIRKFMTRFTIVPVDGSIAELAVTLRRGTRLKVPDAIIWATAKLQECQLVTRNTRDFNRDDVSIRIPYEL